jgi:hypothetical protein
VPRRPRGRRIWFSAPKSRGRRCIVRPADIRTVLLDRPTAEITKIHADAAAALIDKLKEFDAASIQIGSLVLLKRTMPDGRKVLMSGILSNQLLKALEEDHLQQLKPENSQKLLEESGSAIVIEQTDEQRGKEEPPQLLA